ncbi:MAG: MoxR family ATPase [Deltaproteobacteria bacterium]|nr:MAG: MoxR family ATPase [Deltaproteobacteria bacterium]
MESFNKFTGTEGYIASSELQSAVNVAVALERPLLIKGEPGTGKTLLAHHIAKALGQKLVIWNVKSTTKAREGLYTYDTVARLNDARFGDGDVRDISRYIKFGPLGRAFAAEEPVVLLIDEVDKADVEFPNDLLHELDEMSFEVLETGEEVAAKKRPVTIITSNSEKELPDAFLRRCVFHYIDFPDEHQMKQIVEVHHPGLDRVLMERSITLFYQLREVPGMRKRPSTSELVDWIRVLLASGVSLPPEASVTPESVPFLGALVKLREDIDTIDRHSKPTRWR